ncbi:hypothetical protein FOL47_009490 [Perkinsus chesapeaki]|uniref:Uncharacterized protein n=1 Tax=Perkinsus chesapeaki TaxID=330153 RepID=A0A7J6L7Y5_PERCH|nr:hypothetical protein FOL47_009490 [Perkinsus chesapeaki]
MSNTHNATRSVYVEALRNVGNSEVGGGSDNAVIEELTLKLAEAQQVIAFNKIELDRVRAECDACVGEYERAIEVKDEQMMLMRVDAKRGGEETDQLQSKVLDLEHSLNASEVRVGELTSQVESLQLELESSQALVEQLRMRRTQSAANLDQQRAMHSHRTLHLHNYHRQPAVQTEPTGCRQSTSRAPSNLRLKADAPDYPQSELLECVDHLEAALNEYNGDGFSTKSEKVAIRELKKIYGFSSKSADELFPIVLRDNNLGGDAE